MSALRRIFLPAKKAHFICEDGDPFPTGQKIIERYDDFQVIGSWSSVDAAGTTLRSGQMLSRTVKFIAEDGFVHVGSDWIADIDREVTGFDDPKISSNW